jgi:hypothetical protein
VERPPKFIDHQDKNCENGCATKNYPQSQRNTHRNSNDVFTELEKNGPEIHMQAQKAVNSQQKEPEQQEQFWGHHNT